MIELVGAAVGIRRAAHHISTIDLSEDIAVTCSSTVGTVLEVVATLRGAAIRIALIYRKRLAVFVNLCDHIITISTAPDSAVDLLLDDCTLRRSGACSNSRRRRLGSSLCISRHGDSFSDACRRSRLRYHNS